MSYLKKVVQKFNKPLASEVLTNYIEQCNFPPWTSYFIKQSSIINDQWGYSNFNWQVKSFNYQILRTGCYPYIKYHCSKKPHENLDLENTFFGLIKLANLGLPCLFYGLAATILIKHKEVVHTDKGPVYIYFLYKEDKGSMY